MVDIVNKLMKDPILSVENKVCFITGVSTGLGGHFARLLLSRGARVVGISRTEIDWDVGTFGERFDNLFGDITDEKTITDAIDHIKEKYGQLDVLVNNAGITRVEKAMKFKPSDIQELIGVNVIAASNIAIQSAQLMREKGNGGSIINISSVMAHSTVAGLSAYSASKAALEHLTHGFAAEWARYGIRVNNIAPGWIPTSMTQEYLDKGMGQVFQARIPQARLGTPSDLDGACILLASDASRYMTGSTITVDGGYSLIN